jgi:zinc/manganese transport system permease protein
VSLDATSWSILWPALIAGLLVTATHVPLGMQVLARGIVFIDLAIAQIAGLGVIAADLLGWESSGAAAQVAAFGAALFCAAALTWTERRWPELQEAVIGVVYVLAASAAILLLAQNPHGGEHLKQLLVGQILWVNPAHLPLEALVYAIILALWFVMRERLGRFGFYVLFACAVTVSVQLVGLFLVFITLVVPALATFYERRLRYLKAYLIGCLGYALGLGASAATDLPSGPMIVCAIVLVGLGMAAACRAMRRHEQSRCGAQGPELPQSAKCDTRKPGPPSSAGRIPRQS